ncbi:MAG: LacI family transcriptional regulator [Bacilli bacterium]|nr:LacI family transcriptional regulator [Bacilli bacterium]
MKKITLQIIAEKLNVSKALVSKALSNDPAVNEGTRETIWKTAEEMGYRIKNTRKSTRDLRMGNIAVLMPRAYLDDMEYWGKVIRGIDKELENNGYSMILSSIDISLSPKEGLPTSIYEKKVDGAIVMGHLPDSYFKALEARKFPFVMVDASLLNLTIDHVLANNFLGAFHATGTLLEAGHRKLAFVGDAETSWSFRERSRGFEEAIRYFNATSAEKASFVTIQGIGVSGKGMYTAPEFTQNIHRYLVEDKVNTVTAMFCANDLCAMESLKILNNYNLICPDDVSIIGFDNLTITEQMTPKLTTVSVPKAAIGSRAVQMILRRIENPDYISEWVLISTLLIERASVRKL